MISIRLDDLIIIAVCSFALGCAFTAFIWLWSNEIANRKKGKENG